MVKELQRYDVTLGTDKCSAEQLQDFLMEWCNKWVFQIEVGEKTGFEHYQIRVNLIKAKSEASLKTTWSKLLPGCHISVTSNACKDFCYQMKADTRKEGPGNGPWSSEKPMAVMTRQLKKFMELGLRPWMTKCEEIANREDDRYITVIIDKIGNSGKSIFSEYLVFKGAALELPYMSTMEDIMQACMCLPKQKCYLIDMPRGLKKEKLSSFYAGLECLKNGMMYDKRYSFKMRRIDRPQIIVFTNTEPDWSLLSADRWDPYVMLEDYDLAKHFRDGESESENPPPSGATL